MNASLSIWLTILNDELRIKLAGVDPDLIFANFLFQLLFQFEIITTALSKSSEYQVFGMMVYIPANSCFL
jgi:hypothetical protein